MGMKKYDYLVCGNVGLNKFIDLNLPLEIGRTFHNTNNNFDDFYFGGTGLNIAYILAKLGTRVLPILAYGSDRYLEKVPSMFEELQTPIYAMESAIDGSFSYAIMIKDPEGNHTTLVVHKAVDQATPRSMQNEWFQDSAMGILSTSRPKNVIEFISRCKSNRTPLVFSMKIDPVTFPEKVLKEILLYSTIVFMNVFEKEFIEEFLGIEDITGLFSLGNAKILAISDGANGSDVIAVTSGKKQECIHVPATPVKHAVDTTGAGDAYLAGFLHGLREKRSLKTCAQWGSTTAAFVIEEYGCITNVPTLEQMLSRNRQREDAESG